MVRQYITFLLMAQWFSAFYWRFRRFVRCVFALTVCFIRALPQFRDVHKKMNL